MIVDKLEPSWLVDLSSNIVMYTGNPYIDRALTQVKYSSNIKQGG